MSAPSSNPTPADLAPPARLGALTGTLLIVANMIGVGVFTTTGYMVSAIPSPPAVLVAWLLGGLVAFCGALCYAELGAALPRNGGEYQLLSRIYHPAVGFIAAIVSQIVGFAAPLAMYAIAFGKYLEQLVPSLPAVPAGIALIGVIVLVHSLHVAAGSRFHNVITLGKVALILLFIVVGLLRGDVARLTEETSLPLGKAVFSAAFAVQLVYVSFSYSGWNAAAYIAGEYRQTQRDLPRSILAGTTIVLLLYLGLNAVFLSAAPLQELAGKAEVAHVAGVHLLGERGGSVVSLLIVAGLVSTISANLLAGPRVLEAVGRDWPILRPLTVRRVDGGPVIAICLQGGLAALMTASAQFETLLNYIGMTLSLSAGATVLGAIVLRMREPDLPRPFRMWGFPIPALVFLALEGWMLTFAIQQRPVAGIASAATLVLGGVLYVAMRALSARAR